MTTWNPTLGTRTNRAWAAITNLMADGKGHSWVALKEAARKNSDLKANSCQSLISDAVRHGYLEHKGRSYYLGKRT